MKEAHPREGATVALLIVLLIVIVAPALIYDSGHTLLSFVALVGGWGVVGFLYRRWFGE